jgi:lactoylglutathione lyase
MGKSDDRPFRVLGLQQIALGAASKSELRALWVDRLGLAVTGWFRSERENVDEDIAVLGDGLARVEVDLMEPIDPAAKPAVHMPPLNHVGLWIDDLRAAVAWLEAHGVRMAPGGIRAGAAGHDICFIHPRPNETFPIAGAGVLIELVQAPADVIAAWQAQRAAIEEGGAGGL